MTIDEEGMAHTREKKLEHRRSASATSRSTTTACRLKT